VGHQKLPKFEAAFDAPFVNWTRPLDSKEYTEHLYAAHRVHTFMRTYAHSFSRSINQPLQITHST
jgi:hypothetical protein